MIKKQENLTNGLRAAIKAAATEEKFSAEELMQEVELLIKEYLICRVLHDGNSTIINCYNGQSFKLTAEQIE